MPSHTPFALYVHWPWCKAKCPYCDFNSHAGQTQESPYIEGLIHELDMWRNPRSLSGIPLTGRTPETHEISSIFFGGGTPSLMEPDSIGRVIAKSQVLGRFSSDTEITVECNPTSFPKDRPALTYFQELRSVGVNRISVGIQGLEPEWLTFLGREHAVEDALATLDAAQTVFENVNADVIYGLPNQSLDAWLKQLKKLSFRGLTHISAYQLTIEPNTRFYTDVKRGRWEPIPSDLEADFFEATQAVLTTNGYENYEISNFAKPGFACRHNVHVWEYGEYIGIGAGAHGRIHTTNHPTLATQVIRQPDAYLRRLKDRSDTLSVIHPISAAESAQEALFSGLRLAAGCDTELLQKRIGIDAYKEGISDRETQLLVEAGYLEHVSGHLRLTSEGWPRLNSVLNRLLTPIHEISPHLDSATDTDTTVHKTRHTVTIL